MVPRLIQQAAAAVPTSYRACELCDHCTSVDGARHCHYDSLLNSARADFSVPVQVARGPSGSCGLDAKHMTATFLRVS